MDISLRIPPILPSISSGMATGQASTHLPQPVHFSSSTKVAFFSSRTLNPPPSSCSTLRTSVLVMISMLGCELTSYILGASMQIEQSLVGKVLSSRAMVPPIDGVSSTSSTW